MFNIYLMTNNVNKKVYVGQTIRPLLSYLRTDFTRAIKNHEKDRKPKLYNAMRKYGEAAFSIKLLATAPEKIYADKLEQFFIKAFKSQERCIGYNIAAGGGGSFGYVREFTEDQINRFKNLWVGRKHTEETKARMSESSKGKPKTEEHKAKLRKPKSAAHRLALSKPKRKLLPEERALITEKRRLNKLAKRNAMEATNEPITA